MCTPRIPGSATNKRPVLSCVVAYGRVNSGLSSGGPAMKLSSLVKKLRGLVNSRTEGTVRKYSTVAWAGVTAHATTGSMETATRRPPFRIRVAITAVSPAAKYEHIRAIEHSAGITSKPAVYTDSRLRAE